MKRIIALLLSASLLFGCIGTSVLATDLPDNLDDFALGDIPEGSNSAEGPLVPGNEFEGNADNNDDAGNPDITSPSPEADGENTDSVVPPAENEPSDTTPDYMAVIQSASHFQDLSKDDLKALLDAIAAVRSGDSFSVEDKAAANTRLDNLVAEISSMLDMLHISKEAMDKDYRASFPSAHQVLQEKLQILGDSQLVNIEITDELYNKLTALEADAAAASEAAVQKAVDAISQRIESPDYRERIQNCTTFEQLWALISEGMLDDLTDSEIALVQAPLKMSIVMPTEEPASGEHLDFSSQMLPTLSPTTFPNQEITMLAGTTQTFSVGPAMLGSAVAAFTHNEGDKVVAAAKDATTAQIILNPQTNTTEQVALNSLLYCFQEKSEGSAVFTAYKTVNNQTVYLGNSTTDSKSFPNSLAAKELTLEASGANNGSFHIKDSNGNVTLTLSSGTLTDFFLFEKKDSGEATDLIYGYKPVTKTKELSGKEILVAALSGNKFYIVNPCADFRFTETHYAEYEGVSAQVSFTAKHSTSGTPVTATVCGTTFTISVSHPVDALSRLSYAEKESTNESIALLAGSASHSITFPSNIAEFDANGTTIDVGVGGVTFEKENFSDGTYKVTVKDSNTSVLYSIQAKVQPNHDTYAQLGETQNYTGDMILLKDCLYSYDGSHFTANAAGSTVYLDPFSDHGYINKTTPATVSVIKGNCGDSFFIAQPGNEENRLFFWRWGIFSSTKQSYILNDAGLDGTSDVFFYRPAIENEESSPELPGYVRVTGDTLSAGQYLITVIYKMNGVTNMYIVHPSTSTSSRNSHVARRSAICTQGSTEFTFTGGSAETDIIPITFQKDSISATYQVKVFNPSLSGTISGQILSGIGASNGKPLNTLTISSGMGYPLTLPVDNFTRQSVFWLSSDESIATISPNGESCTLIIHDGNGLQNDLSQITVYAIVYRDGSTHTIYSLPVTVLKNTYSSTRILDFYFQELTNSEVFYSFAANYNTEYAEGTNFFQVHQGDALYLLRDPEQPWALNFFAKPAEGYALTEMGATGNVNGDYLKLDYIDAERTQFFNGPAIRNQISAYGSGGREMLRKMVQYAIDLGCVGAMGFTKFANSGGTFSTSLTFRSSPEPSITKEVAYVLTSATADGKIDSNRLEAAKTAFAAALSSNNFADFDRTYSDMKYTSGQTVHTGDIVIFRTHMKVFDSTFSFSSLTQTDNLEKSFYLDVQSQNLFDAPTSDDPEKRTKTYQEKDLAELNNNIVDGTTEFCYYVAYVITEEDANKHNSGTELINTVDMQCEFNAKFQGDTKKQASSTARAIVTVQLLNRIGYVNLTIGGTVLANVYFDNTANAGIMQHWNELGYNAVFEVGGKTTRIPIRSGEEATITSTNYTRFSVPITPQDFFSDISVYISDEHGIPVTETLHFSVLQYQKLVCSTTGNSSFANELVKNWQVNKISYSFAVDQLQKLQTMLTDMLEYGYYCRLYLGLGAPTGYTPRAQAPTLPEVDDFPKNHTFQTSSDDPLINFTGVALEMDQAGHAGFRVYFNCAGTISDSELQAHAATLKTDDDRTLYQYTFTTDTTRETANRYYIRITGLESNWLSNVYKITITRDGNLTTTAELSAITYAYLLSKAHTDSNYTPLERMVAALYNYCISAEAYFPNTLPSINQ